VAAILDITATRRATTGEDGAILTMRRATMVVDGEIAMHQRATVEAQGGIKKGPIGGLGRL